MTLDVARVRGLIPALGHGWVHLDSATGMQVPERVATAVSTALRMPISAPGGAFPASHQAGALLDAARQAVAELAGGDPRGVVLGPDPATLLSRLADALSEKWHLGDELVVTRLDDEGTLALWARAARRSGAVLRYAEVDIETCELPTWQYDQLVGHRTKLVAVPAACAQVGTRPEVAAIAKQARVHGALVVVDAVAAAAHLPLDLDAIGADVLVLSAPAWGGPPVGALVFRQPALLDRLSSCSADQHARGPARLEATRHPPAVLAGLVASVEHLAELDETATGSRRERLSTSMSSVTAYETALVSRLLADLAALRHVTVLGSPARRVPVVAFAVRGVKPPDVAEHLAGRGICAFADPADRGVLAALGGAEVGGVVRVGLAPYTSPGDVRQLVDALAHLG